MSKSRRASSPGSIGSGHRLCRLEKARNERETPEGGRVRLLKAHIWVSPRCVNRLFATSLQLSGGPARSAAMASERLLEIGIVRQSSRAQKLVLAWFYPARSDALDVSAHCFGFGLDPLHPVF